MAVQTGPGSIRYPDVVVDCAPPDVGATQASGPTLVVEVSSPHTLKIDVTDKLDEYRARPEIQLIEPDVVSIKLYRRDQAGVWTVEYVAASCHSSPNRNRTRRVSQRVSGFHDGRLAQPRKRVSLS